MSDANETRDAARIPGEPEANSKKACLGIEIGGTKLQLVVGTDRIEKRWRFEVDRAQGAEGIRGHIEKTIRTLPSNLAAVGVGFGGPVDWRTGRISCSHQIEGWSEFPIGEWLAGLTGKGVAVDNDGNVAAYGEALYGAGRGANPVFYVTLGSGVGGGLVVDGRIYHGAKPGEAEIGHVRLERAGATVESVCSGWAVDRKLRAAIEQAPEGILARRVGAWKNGEARFLRQAMEDGDEQAHRILEETAENLGFGLSHVVHLFHPELIVLGGGLSMVGEPLREAVAKALGRNVMEAFGGGPRVALSALGEDVVPMGALALARSSFLPGH